MRRFQLVLLVCGFCLGVLARPVPALAAEGFLGGLEDLAGTREVATVDPVRDYSDEYVPELRDVELKASGDGEVIERTVQQQIQDTIKTGMTYTYNDRTITPGQYYWIGIRDFMVEFGVPISVGLVFVWFGVRKVTSMVMSGWKSRRLSV